VEIFSRWATSESLPLFFPDLTLLLEIAPCPLWFVRVMVLICRCQKPPCNRRLRLLTFLFLSEQSWVLPSLPSFSESLPAPSFSPCLLPCSLAFYPPVLFRDFDVQMWTFFIEGRRELDLRPVVGHPPTFFSFFSTSERPAHLQPFGGFD